MLADGCCIMLAAGIGAFTCRASFTISPSGAATSSAVISSAAAQSRASARTAIAQAPNRTAFSLELIYHALLLS